MKEKKREGSKENQAERDKGKNQEEGREKENGEKKDFERSKAKRGKKMKKKMGKIEKKKEKKRGKTKIIAPFLSRDRTWAGKEVVFTGQIKGVRERWRESGSWEGRGWRAEGKVGRKVYFLKRSLWSGRTGLFTD